MVPQSSTEQLALFWEYSWSSILFTTFVWFIALLDATLPKLSRNEQQEDTAALTRLTRTSRLMIPSSLHEAYELGRIGGILEQIAQYKDDELDKTCQGLVREASQSLGRQVSLNEVKETRERLRLQNRQNRGLLSVSNLVFYLSLLGIGLSILPALLNVWIRLPFSVQVGIIVALAKFEPLVTPLLFCIPAYLFVSALTLRRVQLAAMLAIFPFLYGIARTIPLSDPKHATSIIMESYWLYAAWIASYLIPMAYHAQSRLLGFFGVGAIFASLRFVIVVYGNGWSFGFLAESAMNRCFVASLIVQAVFLTLKAFYPRSTVFHAFSIGAAVFGSMCTGLTGLILSWEHGFVYPVLSLMTAALGRYLAYQSLANTSIVFLGLWISAHWVKIVFYQPVLVFLTSAALFKVTTSIEFNPRLVYTMLGIQDANPLPPRGHAHVV